MRCSGVAAAVTGCCFGPARGERGRGSLMLGLMDLLLRLSNRSMQAAISRDGREAETARYADMASRRWSVGAASDGQLGDREVRDSGSEGERR
jgi:hypothetical protein